MIKFRQSDIETIRKHVGVVVDKNQAKPTSVTIRLSCMKDWYGYIDLPFLKGIRGFVEYSSYDHLEIGLEKSNGEKFNVIRSL